MLNVAEAMSSDGNAIHYVLPVLWMIPCSHIMCPVAYDLICNPTTVPSRPKVTTER